MKKYIIALSPFLLAFTMPGCPNVEQMKSEIKADIEPMRTKNAELSKALQDLNTQLKTVTDEHNTMKQLLTQVSETVLQQKTTIEQLQNQIKSMSSKQSAASQPKSYKVYKPAAPKRR